MNKICGSSKALMTGERAETSGWYDNSPPTAYIDVDRDSSGSFVRGALGSNPLRLFVPRKRQVVPSVYMSSYGGGLVPGDVTSLDVRVRRGASLHLTSLESTKVYKNPSGLPCSQYLRANVEQDSTLILTPDIVSCFAASSYQQHNNIWLHETGNLALIDWMNCGRYRCGERFEFNRYYSGLTVKRGSRYVLREAIEIEPKRGMLTSFHAGKYNCIGSLLLVGPAFAEIGSHLLSLERDQAIAKCDATSLSIPVPLREQMPGVFIRALSKETEQMRTIFDNIMSTALSNYDIV